MLQCIHYVYTNVERMLLDSTCIYYYAQICPNLIFNIVD